MYARRRKPQGQRDILNGKDRQLDATLVSPASSKATQVNRADTSSPPATNERAGHGLTAYLSNYQDARLSSPLADRPQMISKVTAPANGKVLAPSNPPTCDIHTQQTM